MRIATSGCAGACADRSPAQGGIRLINRLFPKQADNTYQGHQAAVWLFVPMVLLKLAMGLNVAGLNPWISNRMVAETADGIPLESFGAEAASTVMFLFASWGLALFVLSLLGVVVLLRYRALIPMLYLLFSIEQFGRYWVAQTSPILRAAPSEGTTAGLLINWGFMAVLAIGFALSLAKAGRTKSGAGGSQ